LNQKIMQNLLMYNIYFFFFIYFHFIIFTFSKKKKKKKKSETGAIEITNEIAPKRKTVEIVAQSAAFLDGNYARVLIGIFFFFSKGTKN